MSAIHYASPGGEANSMGMKSKIVGIEAQAIKAIKAGTAVKAESGFAPFPEPPAFPSSR